MKITEKMKVKEVLEFGDHMLDAFFWLSPAFERLKYPKLRRAMSGRVTVAQAARIGRVPLSEALYVLNLAAGCNTLELNEELGRLPREAFEYRETDTDHKPEELAGIKDDDNRVIFVDVTPHADQRRDPMPDIARGLVRLSENKNILLIRHPFDPIPLRDMFARKGLASWAEERSPGDWFIYFYQPACGQRGRSH